MAIFSQSLISMAINLVEVLLFFVPTCAGPARLVIASKQIGLHSAG
jgi:hypothetical protein